MNITYLIGNGFDRNQGLATRYSDFYPYFMKHASEDNIIKKWMIEGKELWADLEEDLGKALVNVKTDADKTKFYVDKDELDNLLIDYLEGEQEKFSVAGEEIIAQEFLRSINSLSTDMTDGDDNSIVATLNSCSNETHIHYNFITFNYTNILDNIIDIIKKLKPNIHIENDPRTGRTGSVGVLRHIHGTLAEGMIVGVNDSQQIHNDVLNNDPIFLDSFVKINMNNVMGNLNTIKTSQLIKNSRIICIYGMSIGNTDKFWWEEIMHWLQQSNINKLVIYNRVEEEHLKRKLPSRIARMKEDVFKDIFEKANITDVDIKEKLKRQIVILPNKSIFKFQ